MKICLASLVTRKTKMKTTVRYHRVIKHNREEWLKLKRLMFLSIRERVKLYFQGYRARGTLMIAGASADG